MTGEDITVETRGAELRAHAQQHLTSDNKNVDYILKKSARVK